MKPQKLKFKAVIGLGFGDEGKGITTDYLCSQNPNSLVVRYCGGQQAGHNVVVDGKEHIFATFGSGTMRGKPTYISEHCTMAPMELLNEMNVLLAKGIIPKLFIHPDTPVTTPYDVLQNKVTAGHGSCGMGVGATFQREEDLYSLKFMDLYFPFVLEKKLNAIVEYYKRKLLKSTNFYDNIDLKNFLTACQIITHDQHIKPCIGVPYIKGIDTIIFEGTQGLLLDKNIGFFPHVTRGNTGAENIMKILTQFIEPHEMAEVLINNVEMYLVTRAYQTRHGNGPMSNQDKPHNIMQNPYETNVTNQFQGEFRRTLLDTSLLNYAINKEKFLRTQFAQKTLVITCLDHIQNEFRYTHNDQIHSCIDEKTFVGHIADRVGIYKVLTSHTPDSKNFKWFRK